MEIVERRAVKTIIGEDMIVRSENLRRGEEVRRSDLATGKTDSSLVLSSLAFSSPQKILSSACRPMSNLSKVSLTASMRGEVDRDLKIISSTAFVSIIVISCCCDISFLSLLQTKGVYLNLIYSNWLRLLFKQCQKSQDHNQRKTPGIEKVKVIAPELFQAGTT